MKRELVDLDLLAAAEKLRTREISSTELVAACLEMIAELEPDVNAFISVFSDGAIALARAIDAEIAAGSYRGPLHGVPIAVKDILHVKGHATTAGGKQMPSEPSAEDATVVARLRQAGAVILGKLNMHEFAYGVTSDNPHYGAVHNPWDLGRSPGGSSGGSAAAVSARMCFASIGTDTGASVRLPSALTGVVGIRPTIGRVSNHNVVPLCWSLDTVGPIARSVRDCAAMLQAIAGPDPQDPTTQPVLVPDYGRHLSDGLAGIRVGLLDDFSLARLHPDVEAAMMASLGSFEEAGASVQSVRVEGLDQVLNALLTVDIAEPAAYHQRWLRDSPEDYGEDVRALLVAGELYSAVDYIQAQRYRRFLVEQLEGVFRRVDVIVTPTLPFPAPVIGATDVEVANGGTESLLSAAMRFTALASLAGLPAISVPNGRTSDGLPTGMQLVGKAFGEAELFAIAAGFEDVGSFGRQMPQIAQRALEVA